MLHLFFLDGLTIKFGVTTNGIHSRFHIGFVEDEKDSRPSNFSPSLIMSIF